MVFIINFMGTDLKEYFKPSVTDIIIIRLIITHFTVIAIALV